MSLYFSRAMYVSISGDASLLLYQAVSALLSSRYFRPHVSLPLTTSVSCRSTNRIYKMSQHSPNLESRQRRSLRQRKPRQLEPVPKIIPIFIISAVVQGCGMEAFSQLFPMQPHLLVNFFLFFTINRKIHITVH